MTAIEPAYPIIRPEPEPPPLRQPEDRGRVTVDGVEVAYEAHGTGTPTVLLLPTWSLVHSRIWKAQLPYLARHFRVLTFDGRGNGGSDRPAEPEAYRPDRFAADAIAVMDATATDRAVTVALSQGTLWALLLATAAPERVLGSCFVGPFFPVGPPYPGFMTARFDDPDPPAGRWAIYNRRRWQRDWRAFAQFWGELALPERHSSRQVESTVAYALDTEPETIASTIAWSLQNGAGTLAEAIEAGGQEALTALAGQVSCPVEVVCGDRDEITPLAWAQALARASDGELTVFEGYGHAPHARHPVRFNLLLRRFVERCASSNGDAAGSV